MIRLNESDLKQIIKIILKENDFKHNEQLEKTGFWGKSGAGCIILAKDTNRILLPLRSEKVLQPNTWGTWGGAMDGDETQKETILRELSEEAGFDGEINLIPIYTFKDKSGFKYHNYLGIVKKEFKPVLNKETKIAKWFEIDNLPSPLHFGLNAVLGDKKSVDVINKHIKL